MAVARVFVTNEFMTLPDWHDLYVDFYNFKVCGDHPPHWGRDAALYQKPLGHVQLTDSHSVTARWSKIADPFYRTIKFTEAAHDQWLLYAYDAVDNRYLLLDVFGPDAHNSPSLKPYIRTLLDEVVAPWIAGRLDVFEPPEDYEP